MDRSNTKRIAKNTLMLYFRQVIILLASLYSVRIVLNELGVVDYGVYNVVAGVVTMFSFLSNSMATASQRYFSFELGKEDYQQLKKTFCVTFEIYLSLVILVILLSETVGLWFVNNKLVIPAERINAANFVFHFATISFVFSLMTAPYIAIIIAHEDMSIYAYASLIEAGLKWGIVLILKFIPFDKLIVYGSLLCFVTVINTSIYRFYTKKHYEETVFHFVIDKTLVKEIVSYSGWNLFGASVGVVKVQIMNILLNLFFGPIINAARGVAAQVNNAVASFGANFSTALKPQIIKTYANKDMASCYEYTYIGSKLTFFLLMLIGIPLIIEMEFALNVWLKEPPFEAILFTRLVLLECILDCLSYQLMTLAQATGKIKLYQGVVGGLLLLSLPLSYLALRLGYPAYIVLVISLFLSLVALFARLFVLKRLINFDVSKFISNVLIPAIISFLFSFIIPSILNKCLNYGILRFFIVCIGSVFSSLIFFVLFGTNRKEKLTLYRYVKDRFK